MDDDPFRIFEGPYEAFGPQVIVALFIDSLLLIFFALVGSYFIERLIPSPKWDETSRENLFWLFIQFFIGIIYIYTISTFYQSVSGRRIERFHSIEIFILIFFLVQGQLYARLVEFYKHSAGIDIRSHYNKDRYNKVIKENMA